MKKFILLIMVSVVLCSATVVVADTSVDDTVTMKSIMAMVDAGEVTVEQALSSAIEQDVSFSVIVETCRTRDIQLSNVIIAAAMAGMSSEVALSKMADAGVTTEQLSAAMSAAAGQESGALGYTPETDGDTKGDNGLAYTPEAAKIAPVRPVTSNPGGTAQGGTVSPSSL